jgi:lipid-binding SYLF domain-containing protein
MSLCTITTHAAVIVAAFGVATGAAAEGPQDVVDDSVKALEELSADPSMGWFRDNVQEAKAIVIVPNLVKAGFLVGGSTGNGVAMTRSDRGWSHPSFVTLASLNVGLQGGAQTGQLALLVMTDSGRDALLRNKFQLGGGISVAEGPVEAGAPAATTDILAFSRSKGVFGGVAIEGATIAVRDSWNEQYYGKEGVRPEDILASRNQVNPGAEKLRETAAAVGGP